MKDQEYKEFSKRVWDGSMEEQHPLSAQFEITYRCNIHCLHCYTDPFNNPKDLKRELSFEEILRIFDELRDSGVLFVTLTGGEAIVHPRFNEIYKEAKKRGFILTLFTNGTVITEELADFLAEDPPFRIDTSVHGVSAETFDKLAQVPGSFERFDLGIRRLLERGLPVETKTKAMTLNAHELARIKEYVEDLGLPFDMFSTLHPRLNGDVSSTQYRLDPDKIIDLEFQDVKKQECESQDLPDERLFRCGCGTNSMTINPYGVMRPCTFTTWPEYDLRSMSVREAFSRLVSDIQNAKYKSDSSCKTCQVYSFCEKNPAMAAVEAETMEDPIQHYCDVAYGRADVVKKMSQEKVT